MAAYLLGESSARFLRSLQQGRAPASSNGETRRTRAMSIQGDDYALPYTVRWAASVGGWIVWLPGDSCLIVDEDPVDIVGGLEAAGGEYPEGWFRLGISERAESVYLNVTIEPGDDGEIETSAEFSATADSGDGVWPILLAELDGKTVKQVVDSAIVLASGGVRSLNGMRGDLEVAADPDGSVRLADADLYAIVSSDGVGKVLIGLTTQQPEEDDDGYCNEISHESREDTSDAPDNAISDDGVKPGNAGGSGGANELPGNQISQWPCEKN